MAELFPIFLNLAKRPVLVVGAGKVAARKVEGLRLADADVYVIAPAACDQVRALAIGNEVTLEERPYRKGDCEGAFLVIAATGDAAVNAAVRAEAESLGIPVNAVDDPANCSFYTPAVVRIGDMRIAVSTQGHAPGLAGLLRERLEQALPQGLGALVHEAAEYRARLKQEEPSEAERSRKFKEWAKQRLDSLF
ncbi:MAG: bifunctional precorrin-2 dehydrogenase/sirohydrochlorin ferrochelatase [Planctomycetes bacterium]|nr:bifunctional precorrin-2 dehydrogenase/sirohydrochlorin ferrochelatase [Planctomycetota bacterium]